VNLPFNKKRTRFVEHAQFYVRVAVKLFLEDDHAVFEEFVMLIGGKNFIAALLPRNPLAIYTRQNLAA